MTGPAQAAQGGQTQKDQRGCLSQAQAIAQRIKAGERYYGDAEPSQRWLQAGEAQREEQRCHNRKNVAEEQRGGRGGKGEKDKGPGKPCEERQVHIRGDVAGKSAPRGGFPKCPGRNDVEQIGVMIIQRCRVSIGHQARGDVHRREIRRAESQAVKHKVSSRAAECNEQKKTSAIFSDLLRPVVDLNSIGHSFTRLGDRLKSTAPAYHPVQRSEPAIHTPGWFYDS
ncbi:MAG: hypothetical protein BWY83_03314 [bacterium ADurb.Bin478]|nr:MAG: hypothetical protein BWY83_03314 [bacterium ADurb.Bin478]